MSLHINHPVKWSSNVSDEKETYNQRNIFLNYLVLYWGNSSCHPASVTEQFYMFNILKYLKKKNPNPKKLTELLQADRQTDRRTHSAWLPNMIFFSWSVLGYTDFYWWIPDLSTEEQQRRNQICSARGTFHSQNLYKPNLYKWASFVRRMQLLNLLKSTNAARWKWTHIHRHTRIDKKGTFASTGADQTPAW